MRVVFLFMSDGSASPFSTKRVYPKNYCGSHYDVFNSEGYFKMLHLLKQAGYIQELLIFFESNRAPGLARWVDDKLVHCEVIPEIRFVEEYIDDKTIIFVRGGFKHWHDLLLKYKNRNWLMLYAANTGREKWWWWDIILDDLRCSNNLDERGRYYFPFVKPINEEIFCPGVYGEDVDKYEFCIGASHIHDKKGQWRFVNALMEFNKYFGDIPVIMPGSVRRSLKTTEMLSKIPSIKYITMPGNVSRNNLRNIYNLSKYYVHFGAHGQNDRSPIEALACGTQVIITNPQYHAPYFSNKTFFFFSNPDDPMKTAYDMYDLLRYEVASKMSVRKVYEENNGMEQVVLPRMKRLFEMLHYYKKPSLVAKDDMRKEFEKYATGRNV